MFVDSISVGNALSLCEPRRPHLLRKTQNPHMGDKRRSSSMDTAVVSEDLSRREWIEQCCAHLMRRHPHLTPWAAEARARSAWYDCYPALSPERAACMQALECASPCSG